MRDGAGRAQVHGGSGMQVGHWHSSGISPQRSEAAATARRLAVSCEAADKRGWLSAVIEAEIVPSLLRQCPTPIDAAQAVGIADPAVRLCSSFQIDALSRLIVQGQMDEAERRVAALRETGAALDQIYTEVFTPIARRLGEFWTDDTVTFADVSISLGRLQHMLRDYSTEFQAERPPQFPADAAVLLAGAPGEQHVFGLLMVAEFLRRAGYRVRCEMSARPDDLSDMVRTGDYTVVGLSLGDSGRTGVLASAIAQTRKASAGSIGVMVGGPVFVANPELVMEVGADRAAADAPSAVHETTRLMAKP